MERPEHFGYMAKGTAKHFLEVAITILLVQLCYISVSVNIY
jgi:hypothetical protein